MYSLFGASQLARESVGCQACQPASGCPLPPARHSRYCWPVRRWPYILVVDDDEDFRDGIRAELERKGYQVEGAENGREALDKITERPPLLVLLDLQMPVMNGRELMQHLRRSPELSEVPVVVLSSFGYEWEAELMGAQGYLGKPFEPLELEAIMARVLRPRLVSVDAKHG